MGLQNRFSLKKYPQNSKRKNGLPKTVEKSTKARVYLNWIKLKHESLILAQDERWRRA